MKTKSRILVVEDDDLYRRSLTKILKRDYEVASAGSGDKAVAMAAEFTPDMVLLDIMMPGRDGLEILGEFKARWPDQVIVMLTAVEKVESVVIAMQAGAFDYLTKPMEPEDLLQAVRRALEARSVRSSWQPSESDPEAASRLLGEGPAMARVREDIGKVAPTDATVLISGETGTGKELVARSIHEKSQRKLHDFVAVNCAGIPADLVESELFGHARGAFTGAHARTKGKFELAHGGTLFLDEVGELPLEAQGKLLRILEERSFYPVGSNDLTTVDVRVIAATNRPLGSMASSGGFREDLYYRLAVFCLDLPALRERPEDVMLLAGQFLRVYSERFGRSCQSFSDDAATWLKAQPWKGNVRELRNVVERAVLRFDRETLRAQDLASDGSRRAPSVAQPAEFALPDQGADLEEIEKSLLIQALNRADHNKTKAAALLNLSPPTFYYRLKKYGLD